MKLVPRITRYVFLCAVKESALILMQTVPTHIQVSELKKKLIKDVSTVARAFSEVRDFAQMDATEE